MRKKIVLQFVSSNLVTITNFVLVIILARLLTPTDVGIFSMSAVLIAVAHEFRDFGVTGFLKQEKEVTEASIRSAIGLLLTTSWAAAAIIYLTAGAWSNFFDVPEVKDVVQVLALGFLFIPFGAIPQALLTRNFQVERSAAVMGASTAVYFSASVTFAWLGFAHMTMAWANLVNILFSAVAVNIAYGHSRPWRPSRTGWRRMLSFGAGNLASSLLHAVDRALPDVVLGRMSSAASVGLFSRANATVNMVATAVNPTIQFFALPYLAKIHHTKGDIAEDFLRASSIVNCVILPALVWVAFVGEEIVLLLFGPAWMGSAEAIPWLSATFAVTTLFTFTPHAVASIGRPIAAVPPLLFGLLTKVVSILLIFNGSLKSFAIGIFLGQLLAIPCYLWINRVVLGVSVRKWLIDVFKTATPAVIVGLMAATFVRPWMMNTPNILRIMIFGILMMTLTTGIYVMLKLPIRIELERVWKHALRA